MSLLYDANGDLLDTTSAVSATGALTLAMWFRPTNDTLRQQLVAHQGIDLQISLRGDVGGDPIQFFRQGSPYGEATANAATYTAWGLNKWLAIVARAPSGSNATLWLGDESNTPAGPSAYLTQTALASPVTTSGVFRIGNQVATTRWLRGRIGSFQWWNGTVLSDSEVDAWWRNPFGYLDSEGGTFPAPSAPFYRLGSNGTTDVPDETGSGNTGVITSLSSADSDPFIPFNPTWVLESRTADSRGFNRGFAQ